VYTANTKAKKSQDLGLCQCKDEPNPEGHCPEFCTNKALNIDCDKATCALWDKGCRYSLLSTLPSPNSVVKPFWTGRPKVGWGLLSLCDFKPQQSIIQYTGEVVSKKELDRKAILIRQYLPEISQERASQEATKYAVNFDRNLFLDAQLKGSLARFINHHPRPNCTMEKHHFKGKLCYVIHAGKEGIKKGEELTLLYSRIHNFEK
jgi:SET domain-containing protein